MAEGRRRADGNAATVGQPTKMDALDDPTALIYLIHAVFWALLCTGLFGRFKLPLTVLRMIWVTLVIALFMSVSGCGKITGPGLREPGNWH